MAMQDVRNLRRRLMEKRCPSNNESKPIEVLHVIEDLNGDVSKMLEVSQDINEEPRDDESKPIEVPQDMKKGSTDEKIKLLKIPHAVVEGCTEKSSSRLSNGLILTCLV